MTKSFKMVLLRPCSNWTAFGGHQLDLLAQRSRNVLERRRPLLADLSPEVRAVAATDPAWGRYWRDNRSRPGPAATELRAHLALQAGRIDLRADAERATDIVPALTAMLQELVDYRLAGYEVRWNPTRPRAT